MSNNIVISKESSFDVMIAKAIDKNVSVETMEKLLAMRTQLKQEQSKEDYNIALSEFQAKCPVIGKNKDVMNKEGKKRYSYAPLDEIVSQVKDLLYQNGFSYTFNAKYLDSAQVITCTARHKAGWSETAEFRSPIDKDAFMTEVQKNGSAMTYAKRYAFCQVFGIMTGDEDDDGGGVKEPIAEPKEKEKEKEKGAEAEKHPALRGGQVPSEVLESMSISELSKLALGEKVKQVSGIFKSVAEYTTPTKKTKCIYAIQDISSKAELQIIKWANKQDFTEGDIVIMCDVEVGMRKDGKGMCKDGKRYTVLGRMDTL